MRQTKEFAIGANVLIEGVIVGRSEFAEGPPAYCVEFEAKGKATRQWFLSGDLVEDDFEDAKAA